MSVSAKYNEIAKFKRQQSVIEKLGKRYIREKLEKRYIRVREKLEKRYIREGNGK